MNDDCNYIEIIDYIDAKKTEWNQFVVNSKNGTFLFNRDYMDYHSDRFDDLSLMIYKKGKLYSLLPGNIVGDTYYSHKGLTYGGLIMNNKVTVEDVLIIFSKINEYLKEKGIKTVIYKPTPYIYHRLPSQEDIYALFRICKAMKIGCNISSTISQNDKIKFVESRKSGIRKALANGIEVSISQDFASFWNILDNNLKNKYGVAPVHSLEEIELLHSRFPTNLKLYMAYKDGIAVGGTLIYLMERVVHTQYISASPEGKEMGALDLLFDKLINQQYNNYTWFDFGQSTENNGYELNENLIFQKEGFGGRGMCYDIYEYTL